MNNHKYINIITIYTLGLSFSFSIGNPIWFIQEYKKLNKDEKGEK